jgi:hypothetical protein
MNCASPSPQNSSTTAEGYGLQGLEEVLRDVQIEMKSTTLMEEAIRPMFENTHIVPMSKAILLELMFTAFKLGKQMGAKNV